MFKLRVALLYSDVLGYETGNIIALKKRCEWRGIDFELQEISVGESLDGFDLYYIGGNEVQDVRVVSVELLKNKSTLEQAISKMSVLFGENIGFELLGNSIELNNSECISGLGFIDFSTKYLKKRLVGYVTAKTDLFESELIVGFENHNGRANLSDSVESIGNVVKGYGNNGVDNKFGARNKNVLGMYSHGCLFAQNPLFVDYLIELAIGVKPEPLDDDIENLVHDSLINKR